MKNLLKSHTAFKAFTQPFNISQPMSRIDFWAFYIGYIVFSSISVLLLSNIDLALSAANSIWQTSFALVGVIWLLYLLIIMLCAIARRMRDSGYRRMGILVSSGLFSGAFVSFTKDTLVAYEPGVEPGLVPQIAFTNITIGLAMLWILSLGYIFLGLVRPRKKSLCDLSPETECDI